jgi:hypothetical protein
VYLYEVAMKEISQCLSKLIFQCTDMYENMALQNAVFSDLPVRVGMVFVSAGLTDLNRVRHLYLG